MNMQQKVQLYKRLDWIGLIFAISLWLFAFLQQRWGMYLSCALVVANQVVAMILYGKIWSIFLQVTDVARWRVWVSSCTHLAYLAAYLFLAADLYVTSWDAPTTVVLIVAIGLQLVCDSKSLRAQMPDLALQLDMELLEIGLQQKNSQE